MENAVRIESQTPAPKRRDDCEIIELRPEQYEQDSLFGNFVDEIDA
ncbi:MAG: hypothetical protein GY875_22775 [Gammaproteobacteria bacterium]|nr:hypothetical protein [Gammaproteobacteria bacterium]